MKKRSRFLAAFISLILLLSTLFICATTAFAKDVDESNWSMMYYAVDRNDITIHYAYTGETWSTFVTNESTGEKVMRSGIGGEKLEFNFSGTGLRVYANVNVQSGVSFNNDEVYISIDGNEPIKMNMFQEDATPGTNVVVYEVTGLNAGEHSAAISNIDRGDSTYGSQFFFYGTQIYDGIMMDPPGWSETIRALSEDDVQHPDYIYSGSWSPIVNSGTMRATDAGDTVSFGFEGTGLKVLAYVNVQGDTCYNNDKLTISIDGGAPIEMDMYQANTVNPSAEVYCIQNLSDGEHTALITNCAKDKGNNHEFYFYGIQVKDGSITDVRGEIHSIELEQAPTTIYYGENTVLDLTGLKLKANNDDSYIISPKAANISIISGAVLKDGVYYVDTTKPDEEQIITCSYKNFEFQFSLIYQSVTSIKIVKAPKTKYTTADDHYTVSGGKIELTMGDGISKITELMKVSMIQTPFSKDWNAGDTITLECEYLGVKFSYDISIELYSNEDKVYTPVQDAPTEAELTPSSDGSIAITANNVRHIGRTYKNTSEGGYNFNYGASGFEIKFKGTELSMECIGGSDRFSSDNLSYVQVYLDGELENLANHFMLTDTLQWHTLVSCLEDTEHTLTVVHQNEAAYFWARATKLRTDGELLAPGSAKDFGVQIIGDSISAGIFVAREEENETSFVSAEENAWLTEYAMLARKLDADFTVMAFAGAAVNISSGPVRPDVQNGNTVQDLYEMTDAFWGDTTKYEDNIRTDLIILHLGTNDMGYMMGNDAKEEAFTEVYTNFLRYLRQRYPHAKIVCLGGVIETYYYQFAKSAVDIIRNDDGDYDTYCFLEDTLPVNRHPRTNENAELLENLYPFILSILEKPDSEKPESIDVSIDNSVIKVGETINCSAVVLPNTARQDIIWKVDSITGDAVITKDGKLTATSEGIVSVMAVSAYDNKVYDWAPILIDGFILEDMTIEGVNRTPVVGDSGKLSATLAPDGAKGTISFTSSNKNVLSIDENGNWNALKEGSATITVSCENIIKKYDINVLSKDIPTKPDKPITPDKPTTPDEPTTPDKPINPEEPIISENPTIDAENSHVKTGDSSNLVFWLSMLIISIIASMLFIKIKSSANNTK